MITDLNEILVEWAYRTNDGKPDVKNRETGNVYTVKNVNKDKHQLVKKKASKDDIKKIDKAKEKGGEEKP